MLQVSGQLTFKVLESTLKEILRAPDQKVVWPMTVRKFSLGGEAALLQMLATWASEARKPVLHLPVKKLTGEQIDEFVAKLHGLAAALLCESVQDLSGTEYFDVVQANGLVQLDRYFGKSYLKMLHEGEDATMLCADHLGRRHPEPVYFFPPNEEPKVRNETEFVILTKTILNAITPKGRSGNLALIATAIGSMLHEVFENTDEHATTDLAGNDLKKSIRGFFLRRHWLVEKTIEELTADYPALREFCKAIPPEDGGINRQLMEISVFDSGPGLAQRVTDQPLSKMQTLEEFAAVQSCFREGVSTKPRAGHGNGLYYVLELLQQEKGFIRIRTGRLSLYGDLSSLRKESGQFELSLKDASGQEPQRVGRVDGTLITMLIPLKKQ